jgi:hypothetical protein
MNPRMGFPSSFGWVRYPDADIPNAICYELPSGEFMFIPKDGRYCLVKYDGDTYPTIKPMRTKQEPNQ